MVTRPDTRTGWYFSSNCTPPTLTAASRKAPAAEHERLVQPSSNASCLRINTMRRIMANLLLACWVSSRGLHARISKQAHPGVFFGFGPSCGGGPAAHHVAADGGVDGN